MWGHSTCSLQGGFDSHWGYKKSKKRFGGLENSTYLCKTNKMSFPTSGISEKLKGGQVVHKSTTHLKCSVSEVVNTPPFHGGGTGSNPVPNTIEV